MKPLDIKPSTYIDSSKEINYQDPKFKVVDIVRRSKYKNIFAKDYVSYWSEEDFVIKKNVKNTFLSTYVISDLKSEEIARTFKKKIQKQIKKILELKR